MLDTPRWKKLLIVLVMAWAVIYSVPNLFPQDPAVQIAGKTAADVDEALKERVQGVLEKAKIKFKSVAIENKLLLVRLPSDDLQKQAKDALSAALDPDSSSSAYTVSLNLASTVPGVLRAIRARPMALGLDLQGGVHFLMEVSESDIKAQNETRLVDEISVLLKSEKLRGTVTRGPSGPIVVLRSAADRDVFANQLAGRYLNVKFDMGVPTGDTAFPLVGSIKPEEHANAISSAIDANLTDRKSVV